MPRTSELRQLGTYAEDALTNVREAIATEKGEPSTSRRTVEIVDVDF